MTSLNRKWFSILIYFKMGLREIVAAVIHIAAAGYLPHFAGWRLMKYDIHHSIALHPRGCIHGVAKHAVARHLQTHHAGDHHTRVNTWGGGGAHRNKLANRTGKAWFSFKVIICLSLITEPIFI